MGFAEIREQRPTKTDKCSFCKKAERAGVVTMGIKDKDTKTVVSKQIGACEKCAIEQYEKHSKELIEAAQ